MDEIIIIARLNIRDNFLNRSSFLIKNTANTRKQRVTFNTRLVIENTFFLFVMLVHCDKKSTSKMIDLTSCTPTADDSIPLLPIKTIFNTQIFQIFC
jgi:hypothetical protein